MQALQVPGNCILRVLGQGRLVPVRILGDDLLSELVRVHIRRTRDQFVGVSPSLNDKPSSLHQGLGLQSAACGICGQQEPQVQCQLCNSQVPRLHASGGCVHPANDQLVRSAGYLLEEGDNQRPRLRI